MEFRFFSTNIEFFVYVTRSINTLGNGDLVYLECTDSVKLGIRTKKELSKMLSNIFHFSLIYINNRYLLY